MDAYSNPPKKNPQNKKARLKTGLFGWGNLITRLKKEEGRSSWTESGL
jgi:hypothetical protein